MTVFLESDIFASFGNVASVNERTLSRSATVSSLIFSRNIGWRQSQLVWFVLFFQMGMLCTLSPSLQ